MARSKLGTVVVPAVIGVALAAACSATSNDPAGNGGAGGGGSGGTGTGAQGGGAQGGSSASGGGGSGGGGGVNIDTGLNDTGDPDAACTTYTETAKKPAVDIVWVIDNSCSMGDEIAKVREQINKSFVPTISKSIIDWQVIMIAARGTSSQKVCVDPPLAGPSCGNNPPKFTQLDCEVDSSNSLYAAAFSYGGVGFPPLFTCNLTGGPWNKLARFDATKVFVEVTDDEADFPGWNAAGFDNWALNSAQPPGMFGTAQNRKYIFHSIIGHDPTDPTKTCNTSGQDAGNAAVAPGIEYQALSKLTGGIIRSICETDWSDIFNSIAAGIVDKLSCEFVLPAPKDGGTIDPTKVNVSYTAKGGTAQEVLQDNNKACAEGADGWQWDSTKTKVLLCGPTCDKVKADDGGKIDVVVGCQTKVAPPPK
ncbi:MAG: hypothetical protein IPI67_01770 [Myxococcales bacterium]|nr:hypothetical protein [Myxococcales bacterium]